MFCCLSATSSSEAEYLEKGATIIRVPHSDRGLDLQAVLKELGQRNIMSVLVEGGGAVLGSFFDARLVDRVMAFVAPKLVGGEAAPSPVGGMGVSTMESALQLSEVRYETLGQDFLIIGDVEEECSPA